VFKWLQLNTTNTFFYLGQYMYQSVIEFL